MFARIIRMIQNVVGAVRRLWTEKDSTNTAFITKTAMEVLVETNREIAKTRSYLEILRFRLEVLSYGMYQHNDDRFCTERNECDLVTTQKHMSILQDDLVCLTASRKRLMKIIKTGEFA